MGGTWSVDCHVHLYPGYDLARAFRIAFTRLPDGAICLTERAGVDFFSRLAEGHTPPGIEIETAGECDLRLRDAQGRSLSVIAGRQSVSAERIEVLGLGIRKPPEEGRGASETIREILARGGIPLLAWAPGKWWGTRGIVVARLIEEFSPAELGLCDSSTRPTVWPEPALMRRARASGYRIVAGTDPLAGAGEEDIIGRYRTDFEDIDSLEPVAGLRSAILEGRGALRLAGRRDGLVSVVRRIRAHGKAESRSREPLSACGSGTPGSS